MICCAFCCIVGFLRQGPALQVYGLMGIASMAILIFLFFDSQFGKYVSAVLGVAFLALLITALIGFYQPQHRKSALRKDGVDVKQTMANSPGSIQSAGDVHIGPVTVSADKHLIQSIAIEIMIITETAPQQVTGEQHDLGEDSCIALFTGNKKRIRFCCFTGDIWEGQISPTERRLSFRNFVPETSGDILGKDISFLQNIDVVAFNFESIFAEKHFDPKGKTVLIFKVRVNGCEMVSTANNVDPATSLVGGQKSGNVSSLFNDISQRYEAMVSRMQSK